MSLRVATFAECARYGHANLRDRGLLAPIAGAAGWSVHGTPPNPVTATVVGNTGGQIASSFAVSSGDVVIAASLFADPATLTPTFTDVSGNVSTWHTTGNFAVFTGFNLGISWGIATSTGTTQPKVTWNTASSQVLELWAGAFVAPGTVSADGALATANSGASGALATVNLPAGNGSGSNDLVVNLVGFGLGFDTAAGTGLWSRLDGGTALGDACVYQINAAGNVTPNVTQWNGSTPTANSWGSIVLALQASGAAAVTVAATDNLPAVDTTAAAATGAAIDVTNLEYHASANTLGSVPSLGGAIAAIITGGAANNVWDDITLGQSTSGRTEYRCVYIKNTHPSTTWQNPVVWIDSNPAIGSAAIALDATAAGAGADTTSHIATDDTHAPSPALTWHDITDGTPPTTKPNGLTITEDIAPGQAKAVWLRRTIPAGNPTTNPADAISIRVEGNT